MDRRGGRLGSGCLEGGEGAPAGAWSSRGRVPPGGRARRAARGSSVAPAAVTLCALSGGAHAGWKGRCSPPTAERGHPAPVVGLKERVKTGPPPSRAATPRGAGGAFFPRLLTHPLLSLSLPPHALGLLARERRVTASLACRRWLIVPRSRTGPPTRLLRGWRLAGPAAQRVSRPPAGRPSWCGADHGATTPTTTAAGPTGPPGGPAGGSGAGGSWPRSPSRRGGWPRASGHAAGGGGRACRRRRRPRSRASRRLRRRGTRRPVRRSEPSPSGQGGGGWVGGDAPG